MPSRLIAALFVAASLAAEAKAAPALGAGAGGHPAPLVLPLDWFTRPRDGLGELWDVRRDGATTYSYLPAGRTAPRFGPFFSYPPKSLEPSNGGSRGEAPAEKTYTVVESAGRERLQRPLPAAAVLFASALCGIGGFAWWRCQGRGDH